MTEENKEFLAESDFTVEDETEFLTNFLPSVMSEGPIKVKFKKELYQDQDVEIVLTLEEDQVDNSSKPEPQDNGIWCWSLLLERWYHLKYHTIDSFETWPPRD